MAASVTPFPTSLANAGKMPALVRTHIHETSESLSHPETSNGRAAGGTMLRADLENERETVGRYRERIRQAEAMGEYGLSVTLRAIIVQEQEDAIDLASALGIAVPPQDPPGAQG
jgi:hypothetical protein